MSDPAESETHVDTAAPLPESLPVLPVHHAVIFPSALAPLVVGQERSIKLVDEVMRGSRLLALVAQRDPAAESPGPEGLYRVGTAAVVRMLQRSGDGTLQLLVEGIERVRLGEFTQTTPYLVARVTPAPASVRDPMELDALVRTARDLFAGFVEQAPALPNELAGSIRTIEDPRQLVAVLAMTLPLDTAARQGVLEDDELAGQLRRLVAFLQHELAVRDLQSRITTQTQEQLSQTQREFILREQLKTIQKELGQGEGQRSDLEQLQGQLARAHLPPEARQEAERELKRLERLSPESMEHDYVRTYLDWMLALPWERATGRVIDLGEARRVLDEDHYDLDKIKERLLEYLAVRKLRHDRLAPSGLAGAGEPGPQGAAPLPPSPAGENAAEPLLCFVGPPGVGKTSLGRSIARAMGRKFVRISLGGVHDEAEIRGHRRTYVGALPGRIVQALRRAEAADPVFMLDEIDKLGVGIQGDPAAALLEVLDPAQNGTFVDTYLGVPFDLRRVLFITTANTLETIPPALLDRMEVIRLAGYTEEEKLHIARQFLWPRLVQAHGLAPSEVELDDAALHRVIREYTREAGVRNLERALAMLLRKCARRVTEGAPTPLPLGASDVPPLLGPPRFPPTIAERIDRPGIATGLAWTPSGGDVLFVEAAMMPAEEERLILTGMMGDVMRESAQAALTYVRSNAARLGIDPRIFERKAVHLHVPAGAIPKDGPSAGVTMLAAIASLASGRKPQPDLAMTGEITLRGKVLPVGGIKEKVLAAHRAGLRTIVLPKANEDQLAEVPEEVRRELKFVLADSAEEVLAHVLVPPEAEPAQPLEGVGEPPPQVH